MPFPDSIDWPALDRLRAVFLATSPSPIYWSSRSLMESFDATFGRRIAWKWDAVLAELHRLGWRAPEGTSVLDWGCGTGIAARAFLRAGHRASRIELFDRSEPAITFARERVLEEAPGAALGAAKSPTVLLASHVLGELDARGVRDLTTRISSCAAAILVEPGTRVHAERLIGVREMLRESFHVWAPCPHEAVCPLAGGAGRREGWCHHFAAPPREIFSDRDWALFSRRMGIDLRSLPVSYLVLDRRPAPDESRAERLLGRPRRLKGHRLATICGCNHAVRSERFARRGPLPEGVAALVPDTVSS